MLFMMRLNKVFSEDLGHYDMTYGAKGTYNKKYELVEGSYYLAISAADSDLGGPYSFSITENISETIPSEPTETTPSEPTETTPSEPNINTKTNNNLGLFLGVGVLILSITSVIIFVF